MQAEEGEENNIITEPTVLSPIDIDSAKSVNRRSIHFHPLSQSLFGTRVPVIAKIVNKRKRHSTTSTKCKANHKLKAPEDNQECESLWKGRLRENSGHNRKYGDEKYIIKRRAKSSSCSKDNVNIKGSEKTSLDNAIENRKSVKNIRDFFYNQATLGKTGSKHHLKVQLTTREQLAEQTTDISVAPEVQTTPGDKTDVSTAKSVNSVNIHNTNTVELDKIDKITDEVQLDNDNEIVFKRKENSTPPQSTTKADNEEASAQNEQITQATISTNQSPEKGTPAPQLDEVSLLKREVQVLESDLANTKQGSMEYLIKEMRLDMKRDALRLMCKMSTMSTKTDKLESEIESLKTTQTELRSSIEFTQNAQTDTNKTVGENKVDIKEVRDELGIFRGLMAKHAQQIHLLQQHAEDQDYMQMKTDLLITGIDEEEEESPTDLSQIITDFFSKSMQIKKKIEFRNAKRIGTASPNIVQITLMNGRDKGLIYKNSKKLKDLRNNNEDSYFINDCMPLGKQENQRKRRGVVRIDKELPANDQADITRKKGELSFNNRLYRDPISTPTVQQISSTIEGKNRIVLTPGEVQKMKVADFLVIQLKLLP